MRGEYHPIPTATTYHKELPPRARRILFASLFEKFLPGTTSACAENTHKCQQSGSTAGNYLRVRGEYRHHSSPPFTILELPPRARRILRFPRKPWLKPGNYLRVRGEYSVVSTALAEAAELPPRARRILLSRIILFSSTGTTSACAENTGGEPGRGFCHWNYLRVRGEYPK